MEPAKLKNSKTLSIIDRDIECCFYNTPLSHLRIGQVGHKYINVTYNAKDVIKIIVSLMNVL